MFILILLVVGVVVYFLVANRNGSNIRFPGRKTPEDILKERFVNGEIDEETYIKMKETLRR